MTDDDLIRLFDAIRQETAAVIRQETAAIRQETAAVIRQETAAIRQETAAIRQENAAIRQENAAIRQENADAHVETRRHFDVSLETARNSVALVAEQVMQLDARLTRESADIRGEMRQGFADTQSMIKFSHAELDRRVRSLEETQRNSSRP